MKKLITVLMFIISSAALTALAYADVAPLPGERVRETMGSWVIPVILVVVIIAAVVLVKVLRGRKK